jgi:hypothetical protein
MPEMRALTYAEKLERWNKATEWGCEHCNHWRVPEQDWDGYQGHCEFHQVARFADDACFDWEGPKGKDDAPEKAR